MPLGWAAEALCPQSPLWRFRGHPLQGRALSPSIPLVSLGCCSLGVGVCQSVRRAWQILEDLVGCGGQSSWGLCLTVCGGGTEVQPGGGMPFLTSALGHHLEGQHREEGVLGVRLEYTWGSLSAIWALSHLLQEVRQPGGREHSSGSITYSFPHFAGVVRQCQLP